MGGQTVIVTTASSLEWRIVESIPSVEVAPSIAARTTVQSIRPRTPRMRSSKMTGHPPGSSGGEAAGDAARNTAGNSTGEETGDSEPAKGVEGAAIAPSPGRGEIMDMAWCLSRRMIRAGPEGRDRCDIKVRLERPGPRSPASPGYLTAGQRFPSARSRRPGRRRDAPRPMNPRPANPRPLTSRPLTSRPLTSRPLTSRPLTSRPLTSRPLSPRLCGGPRPAHRSRRVL